MIKVTEDYKPPPSPTRQSKFQNRSIWYYLKLFFRLLSYDLVLWFFNLIIHTFFRDIKTRGTFNIPRKGPVIFVIAPHHNQFIDGLVVMTKVKEHSNRRIAFLIAKKSYNRRIIGDAAKLCSSIPVERAQDLLKKGTGRIRIDPENELVLIGDGTKFTQDCMVKGLIGLPHSLGNCQISSIEDDTHLTLRKPFRSPKQKIQDKIGKLLSQGTSFKIAPHVDNHIVFQNVFHHLNDGKILGIFPEGGSHDRPDLLPLKPGVALMALGAVTEQINQYQGGLDYITPVSVVPVGLNYFHPHKFRSRVVVEFGKPIVVAEAMGQEYIKNSRSTVDKLLKIITLGLKEVTVTCDDYDTLMVLQAARRLYTSTNRESIPTPMVVEMNRRLIKGYEKYKNEPDVIKLRDMVTDYNRRLLRLNLHDHQVESIQKLNNFDTFWMFISRLIKFSIFMGLSLPGIFLFSPVFITARRISKKKAKEALESSVVKIKAKDVLGTWKILVAMVFAPCLYIFYSILGTIFIFKLDVLPDSWKSKWSIVFIFLVFYGWALLTTYASLRVGEIGVDYYKSLKPLLLSLINAHSDELQIEELKKTREELREKVNEFCNRYGPGIFNDYDKFYKQYNNMDEGFDLEKEEEIKGEEILKFKHPQLQRQISTASLDLSLNNLSDIPIFASADLEQTNDINLTKESSTDEEEDEEKLENVDNKTEGNEGVKLRIRRMMNDKINNANKKNDE
ncbi:unnamed protein product [Candida verbasci]|uniref:Phospholipid/glycerol acyltransferase domain-containing protein n=1 Tax=Candida verbasci TaxID=1227364 RepID=A0A9W4X8Z0_9ASCO|nr:unnamed protein product [Candida verbasci]